MSFEIDQNWPDLILCDEGGNELPVPKSDSNIYAVEKAINLGPGKYIVKRPDATIEITSSVVDEEPPEEEEEPTEEQPEEEEETPTEEEPTEEEEPLPTPTGEIDERFKSLLESPNLHSYLVMNSQKDVDEHTRPTVNKGLINPHISYDPEKNAVKVDTLGRLDISSMWQLRKYFPTLNNENCSKVSFQWEFMYGDGYLSTGALQNYKAFQLSSSSENLMFEFQHRFGEAVGEAVALPTIRYYHSPSYSEMSDRDPMSSWGPHLSRINGANIDNWQPGGDTAADRREGPFSLDKHVLDETWPFLIRANTWTRVTAEFTFEDNEMRVTVWMSDEVTPPTKIIGSVREPGKGFLLSNDLSQHRLHFQNWWLELNTSQEGSRDNLLSWHKNFIVYKDASIPLE